MPDSVAMDIVIATRIYRPEPSAASFYLGSVADALAARGHKVTVMTTDNPAGKDTGETAQVKTFPVLRNKDGYVRGYLQYLSFDIPLAFRLLMMKRPDLVIVEPPPTTGAVARVALRLRKIPYVYDAADLWSVAAQHATRSRMVLRALTWVEKFALNGATQIVSISSGVISRIRDLGVNTPAEVVGRGANTRDFYYQSSTAKKRFLYAGSYSQWHGAGILIGAFAQFLKDFPEFELHFVGNGVERENLIQQVKELGIEENVMFRDPVPPAQLNDELAQAVASFVTLDPSAGYDFAFATKTYSSLAAGCPVIFAGSGPTEEFINSASLELPLGTAVPYEENAITQAMAAVAKTPLSAQMRETVANWAQQNCSMRSAAERTVQVIENVKNNDSLRGA